MQNHFVGSQAIDNGSWLKGPKGSCTCSKCGNNVNNFHRELHEYKCWGKGRYVPSLNLSAPSSFDYCSTVSISIDSKSSAFERFDNTPSLSMDDSSVSFDSSREEDIPEQIAVPTFELTTEECKSFNGTLKQTCARSAEQQDTFYPAIEPFSLEYSTDNEEDALRWSNDSDCEKISSVYQPWKVLEDRPTGKYVKAMFSIPCENSSEKTQKLAILQRTIENHLKQYGIDYSTVKVIAGYCAGKHSFDGYVYVILPEYCIERTRKVCYRYGCESLHENYKTYGECNYMPRDHAIMMGFVNKGTPIIPKELIESVKITALSTDTETVSGKTLLREFIGANIDHLKTGKEFTYKDLEEFGMLSLFDIIYPKDADNGRHMLGKVLDEYCIKRKGNSREGAYRNHYKLKPKCIIEFL